MKTRKLRSNRRGFTLMEVLLVLVILVVLGALSVTALTSARRRGFEDTAEAQLTSFKSGLSQYQIDVGTFPTTQQGLAALYNAPGDLKNPAKWRGPYLDGNKSPVDPWQNEYHYESDGTNYKVSSAGQNQQDEAGAGDDLMQEGP